MFFYNTTSMYAYIYRKAKKIPEKKTGKTVLPDFCIEPTYSVPCLSASQTTEGKSISK